MNSPRRASCRQRARRFCASSRLRRLTCSRCSMPSPKAPCGCVEASFPSWPGSITTFSALAPVMVSRRKGWKPFSECFRDRPARTRLRDAQLRRAIVQIPDVLADRDYGVLGLAQVVTYRSILAVPMLRDGHPFGTIAVPRAQVGLFSQGQIALLQTFADQAVVAIENARLFDDVKARTRALSESLEQQTATSEVLQVISSSPGEL